MHAHGFQGMRVDEVIRLSGLQKGAFYHHFGSKSELGYAVLREQIKPLVESVWFTPFLEVKDPIQDIPQLLGTIVERIPASMQKHGCPLNNLAQEMSSQDEVFRQYIAELTDPRKSSNHFGCKMSWKRDEPKNIFHNFDHLKRHDQVKFVLANRTDYEWAKTIVSQYALSAKVSEVLFSPAWALLSLKSL